MSGALDQAAAGRSGTPAAPGAGAPLLEVKDLRMHIFVRRGEVKAVDGVNFSVRRGESLGIVGESGSGKSMTLLSVMQVLPQPGGRIVGGQILFEGEDLLRKTARQMRDIRGNRIAMITQDTLASLNPALTIGVQLREPLEVHLGMRGKAANERALELLRHVQLSDPARQIRSYPHEMSGGMRQRVVGAIAIGCKPSLLLADEPTTALDVTVQAQYLRLLREIQKETDLGMIFVTHDFGIVAKVCDHVAVMYAGRIVETAATRELFDRPLHPYSSALMDCLPQRNLDARLRTIPGHPPDLAQLPPGCGFADRCSRVHERCRTEAPSLAEVAPGHKVACWDVEGAA